VLISVIITNFNKDKYLYKSLKSIDDQKYKNLEIILFDDCSTDKSLEIINRFKKVQLIKNKNKRFKSGPLNQINGILKAFNLSKGKVICLLDSDDIFFSNKLDEISKFFKDNTDKHFVVNLPNNQNIFKLKRKVSNNKIWPSIFPTSCISFRRTFFDNFKSYIKAKQYENLEIDARLIMYSYFNREFNILNKRLTRYIKDKKGISSNYKKYSLNWWFKRREAFEYLRFILKKRKLSFVKSFDYLFTNLVYFFLNLFKKL